MASNSSSIQPIPMPRPTRLPDSTAGGAHLLGDVHRGAGREDVHGGEEPQALGDGRQVADRSPTGPATAVPISHRREPSFVYG